MRRVFGFVACTSLLTALPWWINPGQTAEPARTRDAAGESAASSSPTAAELFLQGREHYLNGRFADAVTSLEAADRLAADLSGADRDRLAAYLGRARAKAGTPAPKSNEIVARGQSGDQAPRSTDSSKKLLADARQRFNAGNVADAERMANECKKLGMRSRLYGDSPEKLLEDIKIWRTQEATWRKDNSSVTAKRARSNYLLMRARQILGEGDRANAGRLLAEAEQIDFPHGPGDFKPEHIRQLLAQAAPKTRKPASPQQAEALTAETKRRVARPAQDDFDTSEIERAAATPANTRNSATRQAKGDADFAAAPSTGTGKLTARRSSPPPAVDDSDLIDADEPVIAAKPAAKSRAALAIQSEADELGISDDNPPDAGTLLAQRNPAKSQPAPQADKRSAATKDRLKAQELLEQAQALMNSGRFDEAEAKVRQADKLDVAYDVLGLTPDYLLTLIERGKRDEVLAKNNASRNSQQVAASKQGLAKQAVALTDDADDELDAAPPAATLASPAKPAAGKRQTLALAQGSEDDFGGARAPESRSKAPATGRDNQAKKQAMALMQEAQSDLEAGRVADAKAKANRALELDVAWDLLDTTPEYILELAARAEEKNRRLADRRVQQAETVPVDDVPELGSEQIAQARAAVDTESEVEDPAVINSSRIPAAESYQRGKQALRAGNTELAAKFYLQAYQSGERLERRKETEIREFLAQHRVKSKKIQLLASRQLQDSELGQPANDELPRRIDMVDDQRQITFQKLQNEIRNATFRAEQVAATNPQKALELIDKAQVSVENSGLEDRITGQLLKQLAKSRDSIEYTRKINAPKIEMANRKAEVEGTIKLEEQIKVRIEQDYADKVQKYNQLLKEKRFDEALVLAKQAQLLMPDTATSELMVLKAKYAKQADFNKNIRENKADYFTAALNSVEESAIGITTDYALPGLKKWQDLTERRKKFKRADNHTPTRDEIKIEQSLSRDVSLHFDNAPLTDIIKRLASLAEVNIVLDTSGLEDEGIGSNTNVSINVDSIQLKSALRLILEPLRLGFMIKDDVLKITSKLKQQGDLVTLTYSVADLVIPIRDFSPVMGSQGMLSSGFNMGLQARAPTSNLGQMNVASTGGMQRPAGQAFAQISDDRETSRRGHLNRGPSDPVENHDFFGAGGVQADFTSLMNLISTTVQPDSWEDLSGPGSMMPYRTTLSLVVRQTQAVHEEIADLLGQLRRLQDLQVTIECRFITVSDNFFERIGVDFNFNLQSNVPNGLPNTFGQPLPPFGNGTDFANAIGAAAQLGAAGTAGTAGGTAGTAGGAGGAAGGVAGAAGGTAGTAGTAGGVAGTTGTAGTAGTAATGGGAAPFAPGPQIDTHNQNSWPRYGDVVGLLPSNSFANNLDIPFQQGSFGIGVPQFGNFNPAAGLQVGFAILSDIETFFLINAAQGDTRTNLLFAPKVTLFNGQTATVTDTVQRPFVTSLTPTVGFGAVGFTPQITVLPEGVSMTVQAVISADRRYVRLTVIPSFTAITDVQEFSFVSGAGSPTIQGNTGGGGQAQGGGQGGFGGGQGGQGSGAGGFGAGGIGGNTGAAGAAGQQGGQQAGGQQGGQQAGTAQTGAAGSSAGTQITVQRPIFEIVSVATTVSVPDGGTVLLGGIKRLREGRTMAGVPILNKIPYISRLFKNTGVGRETQSLMLMVTPRIIIQEEEEELLGVDLPNR